MFSVYVVKNEVSKIYIGHSSKLPERIKRHNGLLKNKKNSYTSKNKGEWRLIYKEEFNTREEAIKREKQLKSYRGRQYIRSIIEKSQKDKQLSR